MKSANDKYLNELFKCIGLSQAAAAIYELLLTTEPRNVNELHKQLQISRSATHTALKRLEDRGFVQHLNSATPHAFYKAIQINQALVNYSDYVHKLARSVTRA